MSKVSETQQAVLKEMAKEHAPTLWQRYAPFGDAWLEYWYDRKGTRTVRQPTVAALYGGGYLSCTREAAEFPKEAMFSYQLTPAGREVVS